jgi:adenine-specific DNA methylase
MYHVVGSEFISPFDVCQVLAKVFSLDTSLIRKTTREAFFKTCYSFRLFGILKFCRHCSHTPANFAPHRYSYPAYNIGHQSFLIQQEFIQFALAVSMFYRNFNKLASFYM